MKIEKNKSLKEYNAFKLDIKADEFIELKSLEDFRDIKDYYISKDKKIIIGDAANILFLGDFKGVVIKNSIKGIQEFGEFTDKKENFVFYKVGSGEIWNDFVRFSVNEDLGGGIENLVEIPGRVGSAVVQNIGAYGVEIKEIVEYVTVFDFFDKKIKTINKESIGFSYRDSIFKRENGRYFILFVVFKLIKSPKIFKTDYNELKKLNQNDLTPKILADKISQIRKNKLPDYKILGNCGSFFKNPVIDEEKFKILNSKYSDIKFYNEKNGVKIPAAWLIEKAGFKGYRHKGAGVCKKHSLIIVNYGDAEPADIKELSDMIIAKVFELFDILLEPEVIFID